MSRSPANSSSPYDFFEIVFYLNWHFFFPITINIKVTHGRLPQIPKSSNFQLKQEFHIFKHSNPDLPGSPDSPDSTDSPYRSHFNSRPKQPPALTATLPPLSLPTTSPI